MKKTLLILAILLILCPSALSATYYLDITLGDDSRTAEQAQSKDTPWKHIKGMRGATGNAAATTPVAGDSIIFKGGETWPYDSLGWLVNYSGNATDASPGCSGSGCIYIGVDQTWFTGATWTRPKFDAGGTTRLPADAGGIENVILRLYANYLIIDNIEFTGLYWDSTEGTSEGNNITIAGGTPNKGTDITIKNIYIHGWAHDTYANGTRARACGILGDTSIPNNNVNTILQDSVIDGSDADGESCTAV